MPTPDHPPVDLSPKALNESAGYLREHVASSYPGCKILIDQLVAIATRDASAPRPPAVEPGVGPHSLLVAYVKAKHGHAHYDSAAVDAHYKSAEEMWVSKGMPLYETDAPHPGGDALRALAAQPAASRPPVGDLPISPNQRDERVLGQPMKWAVIFAREALPPEVFPFEHEADAARKYESLRANWSDVWLMRDAQIAQQQPAALVKCRWCTNEYQSGGSLIEHALSVHRSKCVEFWDAGDASVRRLFPETLPQPAAVGEREHFCCDCNDMIPDAIWDEHVRSMRCAPKPTSAPPEVAREFEAERDCPRCRGTGMWDPDDNTDVRSCSLCEGSGNVPIEAPEVAPKMHVSDPEAFAKLVDEGSRLRTAFDADMKRGVARAEVTVREERWSDDYTRHWTSSRADAASRGGTCRHCSMGFGTHRDTDNRCPNPNWSPEPPPAPAAAERTIRERVYAASFSRPLRARVLDLDQVFFRLEDLIDVLDAERAQKGGAR